MNIHRVLETMTNPAAYLDREKDRVRTILGGTPLSAENIRLSEEALGTQWHGTSWFFLMHLIAKTFTREEEMPFSTIRAVIRDYGIKGWLNDETLKKQLDKFIGIFAKRDLGNIELKKDYSLKIGGLISPKELNRYADKQYEYAMGEGLVRYSQGFSGWVARKMSNFAERIWWHYMVTVFDSPKIYSNPSGESALKALFVDMKEKMRYKNLEFHDIDIWKPSDLEHSLALLEGWERGLISRRILATFKFGDALFVAPRFFAEPDHRPLEISGKDFDSMLDLIGKLRRFPAFPVYKGNIEQYNLSMELQRAGAITVVGESETAFDIPPLVYLVSRDVADKTNQILKFRYSENPLRDFGDNSLTDEIFRTLGRARAYAQKTIPEAKIDEKDYAEKVQKILDDLASGKEAKLENLAPIFTPLSGLLGVLAIDDKKDTAVVKGGYEFVAQLLLDYWNELVSDPTIANVLYPTSKNAEKAERNQVESQIKKSLKSYFGGG